VAGDGALQNRLAQCHDSLGSRLRCRWCCFIPHPCPLTSESRDPARPSPSRRPAAAARRAARRRFTREPPRSSAFYAPQTETDSNLTRAPGSKASPHPLPLTYSPSRIATNST
jgi:hypothetical protein